MPDPVIEEEVVEEVREEELVEVDEQTVKDEKDAFDDETEDVMTDIHEETPKPEKEDVDDEKKGIGEELGDKVKPDEKKEEPEKKPVEGETEDEEDEDVKRGKELIEAKAKADEEAQVKLDEEKATAKTEKEGTYSPYTSKATPEDLQRYSTALPEGFLPDGMTLENGEVLDFKTYREDNPELVPMTIATVVNVVEQLLAAGHLVDAKSAKSKLDDVYTSIDNQLFMRTVTNARHGVPKAREIHGSDEFQAWLKEQPPEIQALDSSSDADDHIRMLKRYLNKSGLEDAKKKTQEIDKKRAKKKKKVDGILKTTPKSKQTKPGVSSVSGDDEEREAFESEDEPGDEII